MDLSPKGTPLVNSENTSFSERYALQAGIALNEAVDDEYQRVKAPEFSNLSQSLETNEEEIS